MKRDRLTMVFLSLLLAGLPGCDITIEDGGSDDETEGSAESGDDDDDDSGNESGGESGGGSSAESGGSAGTQTASGGETGFGESTGFGETGFGESTGFGETGFGETTGGFETGMGGFCDDEPTCQDCYDCAVSPGGGCDDVAQVCANNPECVEMTFCYDECGSAGTQKEYEACLIDCEIAWPDGVQPFVELLECAIGLECVTSCAG